MAKTVNLLIDQNEISFEITKIERAKLYGYKKRIALDGQNKECIRASLTLDGNHLIMSGMTAQGYFTDTGHPISRQEMVGIDSQGKQVNSIPSTLGITQKIEGPVNPAEILNLDLESVYYLEPIQTDEMFLSRLKAGDVYKFPFNYSAGLELETAYLIGNDAGIFALIGKIIKTEWIEETKTYMPIEAEDLEVDELDFEVL